MIDNKLIAMRHQASVFIRGYAFTTDWACEVESKDQELMFKISVSAETPSEAIDLAYEKWRKITGAVPEFLGMLPPPPVEDAHDGDSMVVPPPPGNDDIPF